MSIEDLESSIIQNSNLISYPKLLFLYVLVLHSIAFKLILESTTLNIGWNLELEGHGLCNVKLCALCDCATRESYRLIIFSYLVQNLECKLGRTKIEQHVLGEKI
jgi:hypothetical protein